VCDSGLVGVIAAGGQDLQHGAHGGWELVVARWKPIALGSTVRIHMIIRCPTPCTCGRRIPESPLHAVHGHRRRMGQRMDDYTFSAPGLAAGNQEYRRRVNKYEGNAPARGSAVRTRVRRRSTVRFRKGLHKVAGQTVLLISLRWSPRSPDRQLTVVLGVESWHSAARTDSR
jgi:hypothetical protein